METRKALRIAICGPGRCGKDTAAEFFRDKTHCRYKCSTSFTAAEYVYRYAMERNRLPYYGNLLECYNDRRNHRRFWADTIEIMNKNDSAYLYRLHLKDNDILTGVRKRREIIACYPLIDLAIWIDKKDCPTDPTQEYGPEMCDITVDNNSTIEDLHARLYNLSACFGILKKQVERIYTEGEEE